jgi:prepilin-type N-terminal cleavage/methylation domain-containing protein
MNGVLRRLARLRREEGFTLVELLTAMTILGIVLTALVSSFTSGMAHEVDQTRREEAQENARLALQRMRVDIHCAGGLTSVDQNAYGGFTLTLTEAHQGQAGWCPAVIPAGDTSVGVQWCTVPYAGSSTRFVLYRFLGLEESDCGASGSGSTFQVDYVSVPPTGWPQNTQTTSPPTSWVGNLWPTGTACEDGSAVSGALPTAAVDLSVALDPVRYPRENYELRDQIALRNANRCP